MEKLQEFFDNLFEESKPLKLIFSAKRRKALEYNKVTMRPIASGQPASAVKPSTFGSSSTYGCEKTGLAYQAEYVFNNKVTHTNISLQEAPLFCFSLMEKDFKQANIFTTEHDIQVLASKIENPKIAKKAATLKDVKLAHNRQKNYIIPDGIPCDFLIRLGVMDTDGKVFQKHYGKFRQINRFLEIIDDVFPYLSDVVTKPLDSSDPQLSPESASRPGLRSASRPVKIIDFGCGKAYLTFAIYYFLKLRKGLEVEITGLDLKSDVIDFCNKVAVDLGYHGLRFLRGDIADYTNDHADMVVTLHACDTATDYALINAVSWNTKVILSVPCCQHELFKQIKNDLHQPMLKHGILKDRLTEYLTDGLRGLKLETRGYDVAMIEFTSLEHTSRNIMIKAVKKFDPAGARAAKAQAQYEALCDFYHVRPTIDKL